jgi:predicted ArsR family transcriptional regulator
METDLFAALAYPNKPGARRTRTSRQAAEGMAPRAQSLRDKVLGVLTRSPATADECAALLNITVLACRPRLSELSKMGLIIDTGGVRRNVSGVNATVWRAA